MKITETATLTIFDLMFTSGFWHIMLLLWSPVIIIVAIILLCKYYKKKKSEI